MFNGKGKLDVLFAVLFMIAIRFQQSKKKARKY